MRPRFGFTSARGVGRRAPVDPSPNTALAHYRVMSMVISEPRSPGKA